MGCTVDGCVWSGVAHLTAFARVALAQLGETILHVFPGPDARRHSFCTITLTDASSSIRCNWHINMQELNGLTFFRVTSSLLRLHPGYLQSDKYCSIQHLNVLKHSLCMVGNMVFCWILIVELLRIFSKLKDTESTHETADHTHTHTHSLSILHEALI